MLHYKLPSGLPAGSRSAWSRLLLLPYAPDLLTPFSYSVLAEIASRAWFLYYDRIGFEPIPRARVMRQLDGRAYFNLTLSAQREAEHAATEPITFLLDDIPFPITKVEKGGFLAGIKTGRAARTQERALQAMLAESAGAVETARQWEQRVRDYRWTQAEILQIMEEIEPAAATAFVPFLAARQSVLLHANRLVRLANQPASETLRQIDRGLGSGETVESEIARRLQRMAGKVTPSLRAWIDSSDSLDLSGEEAAAALQTRLAEAGLDAEMTAFLADFGHRAASIGEIAEPRWGDDPAPLLRALLAPPAAPAAGDTHAVTVLLAAVDARERKGAQESLEALRVAIPLQSKALDALAWIMAGARRWTWGAAREAMSDKRITSLDNVFFYELEELKEMMTNEWNISDRQGIQTTAEKRKAQYALWRAAPAPDLLIGDTPALTQDRLEPSPALDPTSVLAGVVHPRAPALPA